MSGWRFALRCTKITFAVGVILGPLLIVGWVIWEQDHTKNRARR